MLLRSSRFEPEPGIMNREADVVRRRATLRKEKHMGLGDLTKKASEALGSDKGEELSDKALDAAAAAAKKVTGGKFDDQIDSAREAADNQLGKA